MEPKTGLLGESKGAGEADTFIVVGLSEFVVYQTHDRATSAKLPLALVNKAPIRHTTIRPTMANHPPSQKDCTKVLLVDDHPVVFYALRALLEESPDFTLNQAASCNHEALSLAESKHPDIVILDLVLPGRSGLEIIPEIHQTCPKCRVVIYSSLPEELYAARSIQAGARAYIHKEEGLSKLLDALRAVREGRIFVSENVQQDLLRRHAGDRDSTNDLSVLSNQELNVFRLIGTGLRLSEIAAELGISPKTVGTHRERIKNKLTLHSGKELDQMAMTRFAALPQSISPE